MSGTLYIVATPIGNLEDLTLRALRILKEADYILAEDTRQTGVLVQHYDINVPLVSYHQHSGEGRRLEILNLLLSGKNLALVTDAGTPGISDPGNELIEFLLSYQADLKIIPIPGASAITTALSVSGFNINKFVFLGFLPKKKRNKLFDWLKEGKISFAFYESPNRIVKSLEMLERVFGNFRRVCVVREMTKLHESIYRGTIGEVIEKLKSEKVRGELTIILELY